MNKELTALEKHMIELLINDQLLKLNDLLKSTESYSIVLVDDQIKKLNVIRGKLK